MHQDSVTERVQVTGWADPTTIKSIDTTESLRASKVHLLVHGGMHKPIEA